MYTFVQRSFMVVVTRDGRFVLQRRDDRPDIILPGRVCHFGKVLAPGETFRQAALNALRDEIGLEVDDDDLEFFGDITKSSELYGDESDAVHAVYVVRDVDPRELKLGQGAELLVWTAEEAFESELLTRVAHETLQMFLHEEKCEDEPHFF